MPITESYEELTQEEILALPDLRILERNADCCERQEYILVVHNDGVYRLNHDTILHLIKRQKLRRINYYTWGLA